MTAGATPQRVAPEVVRPLRRAVLRPGHAAEASAYPGDDDPLAAHVAVRAPDGTVVAVGTVLPSSPAEAGADAPAAVWRVRGMATEPARRGDGLGSLVLYRLLAHVAGHGGGLVWCNARVGARTLYERAGFVDDGAVFELPDIGPHLRMTRTVAAESAGVGPGPRPVPT